MSLSGGPELLVRPFISVTSEPTLRQKTPPVEEEPEAFISWGQPSTFGGDFRTEASDPAGMGFDSDDEEPPERERVVLQEEGRTWQDFRVENPDDPAQYVIVRATQEISFAGPDNVQYRFRMNVAATQPGDEEGEGQEPPAPPALSEIE